MPKQLTADEYFPVNPGTAGGLLWGAVVGLLGLFILGFFFGSMFAYLRNLAVFISARVIHRDIELYHLRRLFDFI